MNKLNYYTRETVRNCKQNGEHGSLCSFKSIVGGPCSLLSCTKNIDQHKSCYGFQDVGNEVELIVAHSVMFSTPENIKTMTIWAYLLRNICHQRHLFRPGKLELNKSGSNYGIPG